MQLSLVFLVPILSMSLAASPRPKSSFRFPSQESIDQAKAFLDEHPVFDGHNDLPYTIRNYFKDDLSQVDLTQDLTQVEPWASDPSSHTDIPRIKEGRLGAQFWSAYISCNAQYQDAVQLFLEQVDVIKRMAADYPEDMVFAETADEVEQALSEGRTASLIGVESGHAINSNLAMLRVFHELGMRYMTLTHSCNTPWADESGSEDNPNDARNNGLSEFGENVVLEMNRLGIFVDLSHVSSDTMRDALAISQAPVIFSHSGARSICSQNRNVPDDVLQMVADNGGVVMINLYSGYLNDIAALATIDDAVAHINHIAAVCGVDCVGIGGDYNGVSTLPEGLEDVSKYPNLFAALIEAGWGEEDMAKVANGNILRAFREMEAVRDSLAGDRWDETRMDEDDWNSDETGCMYEVN